MIEAALSIVVLIQAGLLVHVLRVTREERNKFVNAILSKDVHDLAAIESIERVKRPVEDEVIPKDWTPVEQLDNEEFERLVLKGQA